MLRQHTNHEMLINGPRPVSSGDAERILRLLPAWFGIEAALTTYAQEAQALPNFVAIVNEALVGFVTLREHNSASLEISCIAVSPDRHRSGVGSALCAAAEAWWVHRGGKLLQVKTLGASHADPNYARTRAFYEARGFVALEELHELWEDNPCLLMVKRL